MANIPFTKLEIPNGADNYVFDGITVDDLTELDLTQFPNQDQINEFNNRINDEYVKKTELTKLDLSLFPSKDEITVISTKIDNFNNLQFVEFDYDGLMARLDNIVARIEALEAKVGI